MAVHNKYEFNYAPQKNIPDNVIDYLKMVVKRNPVMWFLMLMTDIIHGIRYPIAFYFVGIIIDRLVAQGDQLVITPDIWAYSGLIFVILLIGELAHAWPHYVFFDWVRDARARLRSDLLAFTLDHSYTYFQNHFSGSLARKVSEGIERVKDLGPQLRWEIFLPLIVMCSSGIIILQVSLLYGALILSFVLMVMAPVVLKLKKIGKKSEIFADRRADVMGQIVDSLTNIHAVKSFAHEHIEMDAHKSVVEREMKAWHKMLRAFLMIDNYRRATLVLFGSGMVVACLWGWERGIVTPGEISTIMGVTFHFTANAWSLSFGIIHVTESLGYLNDTLNTLVVPIEIKDHENAKELDIKNGEICFDHVDFHYQNEPVFNDLSITLDAGRRYGLIGPSGAGKSTFINLLQRFFDVQGGQILIDGQDIKSVTQESLRRNIAVIPQDTALFHRSLMDNIRYGRIDATDEEVFEAANKAFADTFIRALPDGYQTLVGERGVKLSGGQRQRIAIARAILKDSPILILDEATSALDSESEKCIQDALKDLMEDKTVIAIAHRLSTIAHLDQLIVMDNGRIVEKGKHQELLDQNGLYANLWTMQSGGFLGE